MGLELLISRHPFQPQLFCVSVLQCFQCRGLIVSMFLGLQAWPHQCWRGEGSPLSVCWQHPSQHSHEAVGLFSCVGAFLARGQLIAHEDPKVHFCKAVFQPIGIYCVGVIEITPSKRQDFALPFVELHEVPVCLFLWSVKVLLNAMQPSGILLCMTLHFYKYSL